MRRGHSNILISEYEKSIGRIADEIKQRDDICSKNRLRNAFNIYILNQLLIILVHETVKENKQSVSQAMTEIKKLSVQGTYASAIAESDLSVISGVSKMVFFMLKRGMYLLVYCAIRFRQAQNHRKSVI